MENSPVSKTDKNTVLKGEHILLRFVDLSDLDIIHKLNKNPKVARYNTLEIPSSMKDTENLVHQIIKGYDMSPIDKYIFAIVLRESEELIGMSGLFLSDPKYRSGEIWYKLFPAFWGKGLATEAANLLLEFGFEKLELHRIEAGCAIDNKASIKVLEKLGMQKEGMKRKALPLRSGWADNFEFAILREDWCS